MSRAFVIGLLLVSWAPTQGVSQTIAYLGPLALLVAGLLLDSIRLSLADLVWLLILAVLGVSSAVLGGGEGLLNPVVGLMTYSAGIILAVRFSPNGTSVSLARTFLTASAVIGIGEAALGLGQLIWAQRSIVFIDPSMGDHVVGTLGTNSHLFAVKMLFQGLVLAYGWRHASIHGWTAPPVHLLAAGAIACFLGALLASALLATAAFTSAVVAWLLVSAVWKVSRRLAQGSLGPGLGSARWAALGVFLALGLGTVFGATQGSNVTIVRYAAVGVLRGQVEVPKIESLELGVREALSRDGKSLLLGIGLGEYSSRAAMILSGGYLESQPRWMPVSRSELTTNHIYSKWRLATWDTYFGSIMAMPTSSVQAVIIEWGLLGSILLLAAAASLAARAAATGRRLPRENDVQPLLDATPAILLALLAVSFTDVWLEYPSLVTYVCVAVALGLSAAHPVRS